MPIIYLNEIERNEATINETFLLKLAYHCLYLVVISCTEEKERNSNPNTFRQKSDLGKILSVSGDGMSLQPVTYRALLHLIDGNLNF